MSTSGIGPLGFIAIGLIWLVGAAHAQMHITKTAVFYGSSATADGWYRICRYYLPVKVLEVHQVIQKPCLSRMKFRSDGKPALQS